MALVPFDSLLLVLLGLLAGVAGGLFGIGGSIVVIPGLTELLGPDQHIYQAAAMIVSVCVVVPAVYQHRRAGAIEGATVKRLIPIALLSVLLGVFISDLPIFQGSGERWLRVVFAAFLISVIVHDAYRLVRPMRAAMGGDQTSETAFTPSRFQAAAVAVPTGIVAGLLGVGGGTLAVPLQRRVLRIPTRSAIANSATVIVATSMVGAFAKNYALVSNGAIDTHPLWLAAYLAPSAVVGSLVGSRLTHRLPVRLIKGLFLVVLLVAALRMTTTH